MRIITRSPWAVFLVAAGYIWGTGTAVRGQTTAEGTHGMVVSVSPPGSQAGLAVLRRGGNAVDAAVATAFALAVTWPEAGNIGGGGFMMVYPGPGTEPVCVEYRETAPAGAAPDLLAHDRRMDGHKVVGVPGTVAGMALAHRRFGKLPWHDVAAPAVGLAREGFTVDAALAQSLNQVLKNARDFAELRRVFASPVHGRPWQAGDRLVQPELARTLQLIADGGAEAFYRGPIAQQLAAEMRAGGGLITRADLAGYQARLRPAIHGTYRGYDIYGPPPPSSGGICLVEMLHILETFPLPDWGAKPADSSGAVWSAATMHVMIEAMRRAYCDRARWLGDPDFTTIPPRLTSKEYARELAAHIDPQHAARSDQLAPEITLATESSETTHFSVVDAAGMAVANTYTLEQSFGAKVVVRGAGFVLNNEMTDFNRIPGRTDRGGKIGTPANLIAPGKRMLSSQTPTLVLRGGRLVLVCGSPGGRTITNTVLCTLVQYIDFGGNLRRAVDAPRLHHQWFPDVVRFEDAGQPQYVESIARLKALGHTIDEEPSRQGDAHSIAVDPQTGRLIGVADRRRGGCAAGY